MTAVDSCVILARGLGTRMRAATDAALDPAQEAAAAAGLKAMIPVGRPFLDYVLSGLADAGFRRACLVIGPEHTVVRGRYEREQRPSRIDLVFAIQPSAIGTANALLAAQGFVADREFVAVNGDNYYPIDVLRQLREMGGPGTVLFEAEALVRESNIPAERIDDFADAAVDDREFLIDLIEKPGQRGATTECGAGLSDGGGARLSDPRSPRLVSMNCWRFGPGIFPVCRDVPISPRGELELPMAVKLAIERGMKLRALVSRAGVLDLSRRSDIDAVTARLRNVKVEL